MPDFLDKTPVTDDTLSALASPEVFNELSESNQKIIIEEVTRNKDKDGGLMGKIFGTKKENAAMHIALVICILLTVVGMICMWGGYECWNVVIPAIMTAVGYIFGRSEK